MPSTRFRRLLFATPVVPAVGALTACALGLVGACADSLHLDPNLILDAGGAANRCSSNTDCAYPKPVCDTVKQVCFECLSYADCADKPETVCSTGSCVCPPLLGADAGGSTSASPGVDGGAAVDGGGGGAAGSSGMSQPVALTYCAASPAGERCADTQTSLYNCGGCGHTCLTDCASGRCLWEATSLVNAPAPRSGHVAVWTGSQMFIWGGKTTSGATDTGGLYDPATQTWTQTPTNAQGGPPAAYNATAVYDGLDNKVIVWGGQSDDVTAVNSGGVYDPTKNTWKVMNSPPSASSQPPPPRTRHIAVWADQLGNSSSVHGMVVWGGTSTGDAGTNYLNDGAIYTPMNDEWSSPFSANGPGPVGGSFNHTGVWDTLHYQLLVGGGQTPVGITGDFFSVGVTYSPAGAGTTTPAAWTKLAAGVPPTARYQHTAVWAAHISSMLIFGGAVAVTPPAYAPSGADYSAPIGSTAGTWSALGTTPDGRVGHTAVWVEAEQKMMIFGGENDALGTVYSEGYVLDGASLSWTSVPEGPAPRTHHTAVVAGSKVILWGGNLNVGDTPTNTGAIFDASL